jgi:hypothetical protein
MLDGDVHYLTFTVKPKTAGSLLRFSPIEHLEHIKDSAGLAPKIGFISAQPIESEIGQISETQETASELDIGSDGFGPSLWHRVDRINDVLSRCNLACRASPEQCMDNLIRSREQWAFRQIFGLDPE